MIGGGGGWEGGGSKRHLLAQLRHFPPELLRVYLLAKRLNGRLELFAIQLLPHHGEFLICLKLDTIATVAHIPLTRAPNHAQPLHSLQLFLAHAAIAERSAHICYGRIISRIGRVGSIGSGRLGSAVTDRRNDSVNGSLDAAKCGSPTILLETHL